MCVVSGCVHVCVCEGVCLGGDNSQVMIGGTMEHSNLNVIGMLKHVFH